MQTPEPGGLPTVLKAISRQFVADITKAVRLCFNLFTVIKCRQHRLQRSPTRASWWSPACVAILFAFHLSYVPVHLATETHVSELLDSFTHLVFHGHHHGGKETEENHHLPHPASDHALDLAVRIDFAADVVPVFLPPADAFVPVCESSPTPELPIMERIKPPGESPPGPLQPRAPPLA